MTLQSVMPRPRGHVPLWLKVAYSAFMAVLVPVYGYYTLLP